jgi:hypothetical protein
MNRTGILKNIGNLHSAVQGEIIMQTMREWNSRRVLHMSWSLK